MKIAWEFLDQVTGYNDFIELDNLQLVSGNAYTLYFRLIQKRGSDQSDVLSDLRYVPAVGATIQVKFNNIDSNKAITRSGTMAYPTDDRSIWSVPLLDTDEITPGTMEVTLTEGSKVTKLVSDSTLTFESADGEGKFFC